MAQNLLLSLVKSFTKQECAAAKAWLQYSAVDGKPVLYSLFVEMSEQYHALGIEPNVKRILQKLRPETGHTPTRIRKIQHDLLQLLEEFLVEQATKQDQWRYQQFVLDVYRSRGLDRHLQRRINQFSLSSTTKGPMAAYDRFQLDYQREKEQYYLQASRKRNDNHNLQEVESALLHAFLARRFRQACETLAHFRISRQDFTPFFLEESLCFYASHPRPDLPGIHLFYLATQLYTEAETDGVFAELKQGIKQCIDEFPTRDQRNLIVLAINHCLRQSNAGRLEFLPETLKLYQLGLERKLFYDNGTIGIFTFNNILGVALRLKETDWAQSFLEQNVRRLPTEKREEVESLSRARLAFIRNDFDATLSHLRTADYQDFIHHLTARVLQLKIYFARDDYNLLTSHIRSTKTLLRRRKNQGYHQRNYLNIFSLAEKVVKLPPVDRAARKKLQRTIENTEPCTEQEWLLSLVIR